MEKPPQAKSDYSLRGVSNMILKSNSNPNRARQILNIQPHSFIMLPSPPVNTQKPKLNSIDKRNSVYEKSFESVKIFDSSNRPSSSSSSSTLSTPSVSLSFNSGHYKKINSFSNNSKHFSFESKNDESSLILESCSNDEELMMGIKEEHLAIDQSSIDEELSNEESWDSIRSKYYQNNKKCKTTKSFLSDYAMMNKKKAKNEFKLQNEVINQNENNLKYVSSRNLILKSAPFSKNNNFILLTNAKNTSVKISGDTCKFTSGNALRKRLTLDNSSKSTEWNNTQSVSSTNSSDRPPIIIPKIFVNSVKQDSPLTPEPKLSLSDILANNSK